MVTTTLKSLIGKLNASCRAGLEEAAGVCVSEGHREVSIEHFLVCLSRQPGNDFRIIFQTASKDPDAFREQIEACFDRFSKGENDRSPVFSNQLVDLIQDAWMIASVELGQTQVRSGAVLLALLKDAGRYVRFEYHRELEKIHADSVIEKFDGIVDGSIETVSDSIRRSSASDEDVIQGEGILQKYAQNFTEQARAGDIDPIFCRDAEIRKITEILCRRRKNNPICVGEPGVGKTAIAEGLALQIANGDVPESLQNVELWALDIGALQAGASVKGEFEKRLKGVIEEVKQRSSEIILFIDEAHTLIGAGGTQGGSDAANLLKPALARGELRTIAATTWTEYKKYFEKDPALARRFQPVSLDEPNIEQASIILRGLASSYEKAHGIYITDAALDAAARLSARYVTGRQLPDKAIDVLDTACARVRASAVAEPARLESLNKEAMALNREKSALLRDKSIGLSNEDSETRLDWIEQRLASLDIEQKELSTSFEEQKKLAEEFKQKRESMLGDGNAASAPSDQTSSNLGQVRSKLETASGSQPLVSVEVGSAEVASVIADWTGIPASAMEEDELAKLLGLSEQMAMLIKGQDHALEIIEQRLQTARLDLHRQEQPLGVFLLAGPSGVGKTETARETARQLFGSTRFMTTVNMSEYQEQHTISRLIGSPPGYVGYGEGGILTEAIRKKPYSVVLLDEVEKADVNVLNLFYQVFDKGELADGEGRLIDCKNIVFFLTTNLGSDQIEHWYEDARQNWEAEKEAKNNAAEDGDEESLSKPDEADQEGVAKPDEREPEFRPPSPELMGKSLQSVFSNHFKPALLARMLPIVFKPLTDDVMALIVDTKIADLRDRLLKFQKVDCTVDENAKSYIKVLCGQASNGARLIDQVIQSKILPPISLEILEAGVRNEKISKVVIMAPEKNGFAFEFHTLEPEQVEDA